jgi:cephalosporin hydroxylase
MDDDTYPDRPWGKGDNPRTAVETYLREDDRFEIDADIHDRLLITVARGGFLRRIR